MKNLYKVAVIIPSWNSSQFIGSTLDCLENQTFQDWKVFVVDDQSTDSSVEIVQKCHKRDKRIEAVIRNRMPKGAQTCRNIGFELSKDAEYVIWLDADDLIAPYCLEQRVAYMNRHPELDFGIFPAITFQEHIWEDTGWCYGFPFFEDSLKAMLSWTLPMVGWTNIYRRQSLLESGHHWDEKLLSLQDSDFNIQSILLGLRFDYAVKEGARVDYFYRSKSDIQRVSSKIRTKEHFDSHLYLLSKLSTSFMQTKEEEMKQNIEMYHFKFAQLFKMSNEHYAKFLQLPWIKQNKFFRLKLILWEKIDFRCFNHPLLFRKLCKLESMNQNNWGSKVKEEYKRSLNKHRILSESYL